MANMSFKYLEVVEFSSHQIVKRFDVTDKTERSIEKLDRGLNVNLNHEEYFTRVENYEEAQPINLE